MHMAARSDISDTENLRRQLMSLRRQLEAAYRPDTAAPGFQGSTPSTGQCAATSVIARELFGGDMVSAKVQGLSHWFNRFRVDGASFDADITGDQFGRPVLQIAPEGDLYTDTRVRLPEHLNEETLRRARLLAERANAPGVVDAVDAALDVRHRHRGTG
jgi:hypothetical protein